MMETINGRPVTVGVEWFVTCQVKSKSGKLWKKHLMKYYSNFTTREESMSMWCYIENELKRKGHQLLLIVEAKPEICFAYYNDVPGSYPYASNEDLKTIKAPAPIVNYSLK